MTISIATEVRMMHGMHPHLTWAEVAASVRSFTGATWLDGKECQRICERTPKGQRPLTDYEIKRAIRMRADGDTWEHVGRTLGYDRHTVAKYVRKHMEAHALHAATHTSPHSPERALVPRLPSDAAVRGAAGRPRDARGCDGAGVRDGAVSGVRAAAEGEGVTR
jgi:hypothetical protein